MPFFGKSENFYIGSLQCGAGRDAYLQIELSESPCKVEELFALQPIEKGLSEGVDPQKLKSSVQESLAKTNEHFGKEYFIKSIRYIPNDSTHYDLHGRLVFEIIKHLRNGGNFTHVANNNT